MVRPLKARVFSGQSLSRLAATFHEVGWLIPPYIALGYLDNLSKKIVSSHGSFSQADLQVALSEIYNASHFAIMVTERYSIAPGVRNFIVTISEAIEAHLMGMHHVAVIGLVPVIEGVGRLFVEDRSLKSKSIRSVLPTLARDCTKEAKQRNLGIPEEVDTMMQSFSAFAEDFLYVESEHYHLQDKTNRHGILHGVYKDEDFGEPISFFKLITTLDFLTYVSSFRARISWMYPDPSPKTYELFAYYEKLVEVPMHRPRI